MPTTSSLLTSSPDHSILLSLYWNKKRAPITQIEWSLIWISENAACKRRRNLQRKDHLNSYTSHHPSNSESGVDACIAAWYYNTPQHRHPPLVFWNFLHFTNSDLLAQGQLHKTWTSDLTTDQTMTLCGGLQKDKQQVYIKSRKGRNQRCSSTAYPKYIAIPNHCRTWQIQILIRKRLFMLHLERTLSEL